MPEQTIYGPPITTEDLHNRSIMGAYDPAVYGEYANSWFKHYTLSVTAPAGWTFTRAPSVHLVGPGSNVSAGDAQAGFNWNSFPAAHDRFFIIQQTPTFIQCTCWAGSHSMIINLACDATHP